MYIYFTNIDDACTRTQNKCKTFIIWFRFMDMDQNTQHQTRNTFKFNIRFGVPMPGSERDLLHFIHPIIFFEIFFEFERGFRERDPWRFEFDAKKYHNIVSIIVNKKNLFKFCVLHRQPASQPSGQPSTPIRVWFENPNIVVSHYYQCRLIGSHDL